MEKTKTLITKKEWEIAEYCNTLLKPFDSYFAKAPEAGIDEDGDLCFNFVFKEQPCPSDANTLHFFISNITDLDDESDLYWAVADELVAPASLHSTLTDTLDACVEWFNLTKSDKAAIRKTILKVFPLITQAFYNEVYGDDRKKTPVEFFAPEDGYINAF